MKKKFDKMKWMILLMIGLVVLSVSITILVVMHMVSKQTAQFPQNGTTQDANTQILVENVYITECEDNWITFLYRGETYRFRGQTTNSYRGIADIYFLDNKIEKIALKKDFVKGALLSYDENHIEVEGYGLVERTTSLELYRIVDGQVRTSGFSELSIGEENLDYVTAEGKICAVIKNEDDIQVTDKEDTIRVLLKNGENLVYRNLYITGSKKWTINGAEQDADVPVDMVYVINQIADKADRTNQASEQSLEATMVHTAQAVCDGGFLYITDENGGKISNGYEGILLIREWEGGVVLINQIGVEDYVRYVLPSEMESTFPFEAQKAQAVCARTFAYAQMQNKTYAAYGANVDDSTAFQVYNRFGTSSMTDLAVEETKGQLMVYDGQPINCYYFSTSNGFTEDMEAWGEENPPYITAQDLLLSDVSVGRLNLRANYIDFLQEAPQSYDSDSPYYRWSAILNLDAYTDASLGKIKSITLTKRSDSGYVRSMDVCYEKMTQTLTDENEIRKLLGKLLCEVTLSDGTTRTDMTMLPSASFVITEQDGQKYTVSGGGFGHGIGMSQYAAGKMAELGMDYKEILVFFYRNALLAQSL